MATAINVVAMLTLSLFIILAYSLLASDNASKLIQADTRTQLNTAVAVVQQETVGVVVATLENFAAMLRARTRLTAVEGTEDIVNVMCRRIASPIDRLTFLEIYHPRTGTGGHCEGNDQVQYFAHITGFADSSNTSAWVRVAVPNVVNGTLQGYIYPKNFTISTIFPWSHNTTWRATPWISQEDSRLGVAGCTILCGAAGESCPDDTNTVTNSTLGTFCAGSDASELSDVLRRSLDLRHKGTVALVVSSGHTLLATSEGNTGVGSLWVKIGYPDWREYNGSAVIQKLAREIGEVDPLSPDLDLVSIGSSVVSSAHFAVGNMGVRWTLFIAMPSSSVYGSVNKMVSVSIGVAVAITLAVVLTSWGLNYLFVSRPLSRMRKAVSSASTMDREQLAATMGLDTSKLAGVEGRAISTPSTQRLRRPNSGHGVSDVAAVENAVNRMCDTLLIVSRYVSHELVTKAMSERLLSCPLTKNHLSVMFCDLEGSTATLDTCEKVGMLNDFASMLNILLREIAKTAQSNGGYVDKLMGDSVMVLFGAVRQDDHHEESACRAAIAIQEHVAALYEKWRAEELYANIPQLKVRIGVASGMAFVGDLGSADTLTNFTGIGTTVCTGARLEHGCKFIRPKSLILIAGETWQAAKEGLLGTYLAHAVGPCRIRGRADLLQLHTLVGRLNSVDQTTVDDATTFGSAVSAFQAGDYENCAKLAKSLSPDFMPEATAQLFAVCKKIQGATGSAAHTDVALYDMSEENVMCSASRAISSM